MKVSHVSSHLSSECVELEGLFLFWETFFGSRSHVWPSPGTSFSNWKRLNVAKDEHLTIIENFSWAEIVQLIEYRINFIFQLLFDDLVLYTCGAWWQEIKRAV